MAAPNIVNVANILATSSYITASNIMSNVVINSTTSSTVVKINTVMVTNFSGNAIGANVDVFRAGVGYLMSGGVSIPANSTLVVSGKDTAFYLIEGDTLRGNVSANSSAYITSSYEIIS